MRKNYYLVESDLSEDTMDRFLSELNSVRYLKLKPGTIIGCVPLKNYLDEKNARSYQKWETND